jgi:pimeloyl-ACP methyl ester carboxylesterase
VRRLWWAAVAAVVVLAALLAINAVVLGSETKGATVSAPGGEILELSSVDLQIVDRPASDPGRDGEGAPIVLLHCYACSLRWWQRLTPLLNANHRVAMVDLIGFGGSQKPKGGYSIGEQARAVAEALNRLGVEGAVIVGHSMGGEVATAVAESSSELVDRVAVIGTRSSTDEAQLPLEARLTYAPVLGEAVWRLRPDGLIKRGYEDAFAPGFDFEAAFDDPDQVVVDNRAMTYTSYERTADEADRFSEAGTVAARLAAAGVPLLAIFGSEDQIVDPAAAAASFEAVPGATVRTLDGVGHSPNLEAPEETAELLLRFAAAAPPPASERRPRGGGTRGREQRGGRAGRDDNGRSPNRGGDGRPGPNRAGSDS